MLQDTFWFWRHSSASSASKIVCEDWVVGTQNLLGTLAHDNKQLGCVGSVRG